MDPQRQHGARRSHGEPARVHGRTALPARLRGSWAIAVACIAMISCAHADPLATLVVQPSLIADEIVADAVVESSRQTNIAAQVSGSITALYVKAGDHVSAGQRLLAIDQRAADQQSAAARAQVSASHAELEVARRELARTQILFDKKYVSQAALERAKARYQAASSIALARQAEAGAAAVAPTLHSIAAPYAGTIARVEVELGSMAMPGTPLVTLFDPAALRAVATLPQSRAAALRKDLPVRIELPDVQGASRWQTAMSVTVLPVIDPQSDSLKIRLALPSSAGDVGRPGMFARAHFVSGSPRPRLMVPLSAVIRRTEVTAVYVVARDGSATLTQVRLGEVRGDLVEILAGLSGGERIALDAVAAARQ